MINFNKIIAERRLIFDGAMGTQLMKFNLTIDDYNGYESAPEILNLTRPSVVQAVHEKYFKVGVDIVETNSFGSSPLTLGEYDLSAKAKEISCAAARVAREATDAVSTDDKPRYVSATGVDAGRCAIANKPCKTISYAAQHANKGDLIKIASGNYAINDPDTLFYSVPAWNLSLGNGFKMKSFGYEIKQVMQRNVQKNN